MRRALFALVMLLGVPGLAAVRQGSTVTVARDEVIDEDLYVTAGTVSVLGKVNGDLVVAAGTVDVQGEVQGDLVALGGRLAVDGAVGGSLRALGGQLVLRAPVAKDVLFAGSNLDVEPAGAVGRDLLALAGTVALRGPVERNVRAQAGQLTAASRIGGDLTGNVEALRLADQAYVGRDVAVTSPNPIDRSPAATVAGDVRPIVLASAGSVWVAYLLAFLRAVVGFSLLALVWRVLFPGFSVRAIEALRTEPGPAVGFGALGWVLGPAAALVAIAVGAVIGGWWLGLIGLGALAVAGLIAYPLVGALLGELVLDVLFQRKGHRPWASELVGLVILVALSLVPVVGIAVVAGTLVFGLGALLRALPGRLRLRSTARLDEPQEQLPLGMPALGSPS